MSYISDHADGSLIFLCVSFGFCGAAFVVGTLLSVPAGLAMMSLLANCTNAAAIARNMSTAANFRFTVSSFHLA